MLASNMNMVYWSVPDWNNFTYVCRLLVIDADEVAMVDLDTTAGNYPLGLLTFEVLFAFLVSITARIF